MAPEESTYTDLLIIGAGPAGLMAAAWASKYNITARILDDKADRVQTGHADGLTCRTMEILDSFGMADVVAKESSHDILMRSWVTDPSGNGIQRQATVVSQKPGVSRFRQCILNQGRLEQLFQEMIQRSGKIKVERNIKTLKLQLNQRATFSGEGGGYPAVIEVRHVVGGIAPTTSESGPTVRFNNSKPAIENASYGLPLLSGDRLETIHAKYVIGCDGAHSWTRGQCGVVMHGDTTDAIWGVLDIVPLTDFPDIRQTCAIYSVSHGAIHLVPREGKIVRLYIQLAKVRDAQAKFDRSSVTPRLLLQTAQRILAPYSLDYRVCDWWSVYQVGQRVADLFDVGGRVYFAGDAIHTHSPKIGQGMNVSIQDTYNLGWKICSVIAGLSPPEILKTYESERRQVALELLEVDRATSRYYSGQTADEKARGVPREDLQTFRNRMYAFLSGVAIVYRASALVQRRCSPVQNGSEHDNLGLSASATGYQHGCGTGDNQQLAHHIPIGQRIHSFKVLNHASARPTHIAELLSSTGQWRTLVFAGDLTISIQMDRLKKLGAALAEPYSCLHRYSRAGWQPIELFTILAGKRDDTPLLTLPAIFHPYDETTGWDYGRVFSDEESVHDGGGNAYERYGIDPSKGCVVCCRPDQHVGYIGVLEDSDSLERYYSQFMRE